MTQFYVCRVCCERSLTVRPSVFFSHATIKHLNGFGLHACMGYTIELPQSSLKGISLRRKLRTTCYCILPDILFHFTVCMALFCIICSQCMRAITTDVVMFHTLCVCLLDTTAVSPTKTDDSIEIPLEEQTNGPKEPCIRCGPHPPRCTSYGHASGIF